MQRFKLYIKKHFIVFLFFIFLFIFMWMYYCYSFVDLPNKYNMYETFTYKDTLINLCIDNYQGYKFISILSLPFTFALNFIISNDNPLVVVRIKNRSKYIVENIVHTCICAFTFSFLHEIINITFVFLFFPTSLILELKFLYAEFINFLCLLLYFFRMGGLFLLIRYFSNPKIAPVITSGLYIIEYWLYEAFEIYLPINDSVPLFNVITGNMKTDNISLLFIRGIAMTIIIFACVYLKFMKKDIFKYEKK